MLTALETRKTPALDRIADSLPVMPAAHRHSYGARVARDRADAGYCAAKKCRFHGVGLHFLAQRNSGCLPIPARVWLCKASHHD